MELLSIKYYFRRFICWILLLQMVNVSIDPIEDLSLCNTLKFYHQTKDLSEAASMLEWVAANILGSNFPESDSENNFLEEFSIGIVWPQSELRFIHTGEIKDFTSHFGHYINSFIPHYIEPHSPPPNKA